MGVTSLSLTLSPVAHADSWLTPAGNSQNSQEYSEGQEDSTLAHTVSFFGSCRC